MKNIFKFLMLSGTLFMASCTNIVDDVNNDPNNYTDTSLSLVLNHSILNTSSIAESDPTRIATLFTDQFTGFDRQYGTINGYTVNSAFFNAYWGALYQDGISQSQIAKEKAIALGNKSAEGIAEVLEGYYFAEAASMFGDVPFSEVNDVANYKSPTYEGQVSVLNSAIDLIEKGAANAGTASAANNVYSTSSSWSDLGNALAARYKLGLGDYAGALASAEAANFDSTAKTVNITHGTGNNSENLFWQFQVEQRTSYLIVGESYMYRMLSAGTDVSKENAKTDESARKAYYALDDDLINLNTSNGFASIDASFPLISFAEVQLIIAESAARVGDSAKALAALNKVRASNASVYGGGKYDAYTLADFAAGGIANKGGSQDEALLMEILKEKYCSVIGLPTFYDVNRTKNLINVPIKNSNVTKIPQRYLYPASEASSNENFPGLVDLFEATPVNK